MMRNLNRQKGLTLVEIILTLILVSIVGAIAAVKIGTSSSELSGAQQAERFASDLRHVQTLAMNWGCSLRVTNISGGYKVMSNSAFAGKPCNTAGATITDPATKAPYTVTLSGGMKFSAAFSIDFDSTGRPTTGAVINSTKTDINLTVSGSQWRVSIAPITGLATVTKL